MDKEMKDSGVEWIGKIPKRWNVVNFKTVMYKKKDLCPKYSNQNILSLTMNGVIVRDLVNPSGKMPASFDGYQIVSKGNLLLCLFDIDVTPRCVGLIKDDGLTSPAYSQYVLRGDNHPNFYNYFLTYLDNKKVLLHLTKSLRNTLTDSDFGVVKTVLPPLKEQRNIAKFLDQRIFQVNGIIKNTGLSIEELEIYRQALIIETVTKGLKSNVEMKDTGIDWIGVIPESWNCLKIKYITKISRGKFSHRPRNDERYYDGDYPFIQTGDVARANKYVTSYSQSLNELGKGVSKEFPKGTLVMTIAANVGDIAVLDFDSYFPDSIIGFVPNDGFYWNYLYYIFCAMKEIFISTAIVSTQLNLNVERVKELFIPVTRDEEEQRQIADYLDEKCAHIDGLIEQKQQLIIEFENYKKSLIYEYVTGKKEVL